ncbi:MAG: cAMP-binding protein [Pseudomonadota bacterium]|jgi:CRP-like cAMP-binding protein
MVVFHFALHLRRVHRAPEGPNLPQLFSGVKINKTGGLMNLSMLKSIYLFNEFSEDDLKKIAATGIEKTIVAGQEIFSVGQEASAFYVVLMGSVKLTVNSGSGDEIQIRTLGSGAHFGEMPLIDGEKRSASVQAVETCHVLEIPYGKLLALFEKDLSVACRFYRSAAKFMAIRLRATTNDLNQLKEIKFQH